MFNPIQFYDCGKSRGVVSTIPIGNIVSYYKLEGDALDSKGSNNGTATAVTYETGTVGQRAVFNGTTAKIDCGNAANLNIYNGSLVTILKATSIGASYRGVFSKDASYGLVTLDGILGLYSFGGITGFRSTGININDGVNRVIILTFQNGVTNGTKIYVDNTLVLTTTMTIPNQLSPLCIGQNNDSQKANASIDDSCLFNVVLTLTQIAEITTKLNSGISLI